ncbi:MAG: hypothetical protein ACLFP1_03085 [Candidatus Goldiibacteriota bacterium]
MDCRTTRSKLKEYAEGKIYDNVIKENMEEHIKNCVICMKELEMWQNVVDKQKKINRMRSSANFAGNLSKRQKSTQKNPINYSAAHKMLSVQRLFSNKTGCLVMQVILLMFVAGVFYFLTDTPKSPVFIILMGISAASMIFVMVKNIGKRKK